MRKSTHLRQTAALCGIAAALTGASPLPLQRSEKLDPATSQQIATTVRRTLAEDGTPSASIAIVLDGQLAYAAAFGHATLSPQAPATTQTRYQLASLSKSITAAALLLLEQDGKLSLDDPVARWLPDLTQANQVTVRELLEHTAGYPDHYPQTYPAGPRTRPTTPDAILAEWAHHPLLFTPGTDFHYSNLNYVIAGRIAEKVVGEPLFAYLRQRMFGPLGMTSTMDLDEITPATPDVATGYVRHALAPRQAAPAEGRGWSFGAGQVVTTATDLARWDEAFLAGTLLRPAQAQEEVSAPQLASGNQSEYALGLYVSQTGGRTIYSHVGQGLGFLAVNRIYPSERAAVVVLTNDSSALAFAHIADRIEYLAVPPTLQDADARRLFASVQSGRPDRTRFTTDLNAYFDERMARQYRRSLGPLGPPVSFKLRSQNQADGITTSTYDVVAGVHGLRLVEQVVADGKLESFEVQEVLR